MTNTTSKLSSVVNAVTNDALRDIKPPVAIPTGWEWVPWVLGALVLGGILAALIWWLIKKRTEVRPEIVLPPHVRARRKLEEALALIGQPEPFVVAVSGALRVYLEERFDFRAPERTTEEFLHELGDTPRLSKRQKDSLSDFLQCCDLVKFAKYEPGEAELRGLHASALRLIEETEPPPDPTATTAAPAPANSAPSNPQSALR